MILWAAEVLPQFLRYYNPLPPFRCSGPIKAKIPKPRSESDRPGAHKKTGDLRYKFRPGGVYPEMKSKLMVFFAGFGAGLVAAVVVISLALDPPPGDRVASRPTIVYDDTNAAAMWTDMTVRWKTPK